MFSQKPYRNLKKRTIPDMILVQIWEYSRESPFNSLIRPNSMSEPLKNGPFPTYKSEKLLFPDMI